MLGMPTVLSRKELYDKVWSVPMHTLSKELGMSDVGLAKACRRRGIPVPPRGYWAKKHAGKRVSQPPLPPRAPGQSDSIRFDDPASRPPAPPPPAPDPKPVHPSIAAESEPANAITVRDDLRITHPLLRSTREAWKLLGTPSRPWDVPLPERIQVSLTLETVAIEQRHEQLKVLFLSVVGRRRHQEKVPRD